MYGGVLIIIITWLSEMLDSDWSVTKDKSLVFKAQLVPSCISLMDCIKTEIRGLRY